MLNARNMPRGEEKENLKTFSVSLLHSCYDNALVNSTIPGRGIQLTGALLSASGEPKILAGILPQIWPRSARLLAWLLKTEKSKPHTYPVPEGSWIQMAGA